MIFEASIKRQSLKRRLKDCLDEYKRIVKLLGDRGREQEANEANIKLREVCSAKSDSISLVPLPWPVSEALQEIRSWKVLFILLFSP